MRLRRPKAMPVEAPDPTEVPKACGKGHDLTKPGTVHVDRQGAWHCRVCWAEDGPPRLPPHPLIPR